MTAPSARESDARIPKVAGIAMTYSQGLSRAVSTTAETAMSDGFQSRPEGEPASASGTFVASVQPVLDVVGPEVQRLVQCRARQTRNS